MAAVHMNTPLRQIHMIFSRQDEVSGNESDGSDTKSTSSADVTPACIDGDSSQFIEETVFVTIPGGDLWGDSTNIRLSVRIRRTSHGKLDTLARLDGGQPIECCAPSVPCET